MSSIRSRLSRHGVDALIVTAAVSGAVGTLLRRDPQRPDGAMLWLAAGGVLLVVLPLLLRRAMPFAAPATTWLLAAGLSFLDGNLVTERAGIVLAGLGAGLLLGNLRNERQARIGLVIVLAAAATLVYNDPEHSGGDLFFTPVMFGTAWLVGFALRGRAEQTEAAEQRAAVAEREREVAARIAVAEERGRIARELHDVVAHAVSVMVLQVGAVRHRMAESDAENREALKNVEQAGRAALAEMRRLLDAMRRDEDELELQPQPGLGSINALVSDVRAAGLDVRLHVHGDPVELPAAVDLSAYRILQEGLTNALKHSHAEHAEVEVTYRERDLLVSVRDDGRGATSSEGVGHGLVGIRERVKIYGGEMTAGSTNGRGFLLRARLPLSGR